MMESNTKYQQKNGHFPGMLRGLFYAVSVVFLLCCIAFLILDYLQVKSKLAAIDDKMDAVELTLKEAVPKAAIEPHAATIDNKTDAGSFHVRLRRAAALSLEDLEKRLQVLEMRALKANNSSQAGEPCKGKDGRDGRDGKPGRDGRDGLRGPSGRPGTPGLPGTQGREGRKGQVGPRGLLGPKGDVGQTGDKGVAGPPGPKGQKGQEGQGLSGVKYVRWGRTNCSGDAEVVYKGIMGGNAHNHPGGGSNYLCLPNKPKYDRYNDGWQGTGAIYGTEYEVSSFNPFTRSNLHDHEAPCVVCYVRSRGSQLMMPARNDCPSGWIEEYHGYLMTEHYNHPSSREFICVDGEAEYVPGSAPNLNGALLYLVQGACGSLPCLPYVNGRELTCAVCTK